MTVTREGQGIKDALITQAKQMIQEKKDAKAAVKAEAEAAAEQARLLAEEEAEEAKRWLTHEELRTGNYERYIAAGSLQGDVDEKNKELLLTDGEFVTVGVEQGRERTQYQHPSAAQASRTTAGMRLVASMRCHARILLTLRPCQLLRSSA